eukprot:997134-Amphidinium_carterae.1
MVLATSGPEAGLHCVVVSCEDDSQIDLEIAKTQLTTKGPAIREKEAHKRLTSKISQYFCALLQCGLSM